MTTTTTEQRVSGPTVEVRVLHASRPDGAPLEVEVAGEVWERVDDQARARREIREWQLRDELAAVAGDRATEALRLLDEHERLLASKFLEGRAAVLRTIGQFLCQAGAGGTWRMLFFSIVLEDGALWPGPYEPDAEWRAIWGETWRGVLTDPTPRMRWLGDGDTTD